MWFNIGGVVTQKPPLVRLYVLTPFVFLMWFQLPRQIITSFSISTTRVCCFFSFGLVPFSLWNY